MARRFTRVVTTPAAARLPQSSANRPFVSLTSDWGVRDPSPAICRAVVLSVAPEALIVDVSHEIEKYNIGHGALMLWCALPFLPIGAHMCVIDPGVGTTRRPVALETARGDYLVGPDNGVLLPGAERLGGVTRAHLIENAQYRLPVVSSTFHGRDLFAPAAAHLASGVPLEVLGPPINPEELAKSDWPAPAVSRERLETSIIYRDTFGNLKLSALAGDVPEAFAGIGHGEWLTVRFGASSKPTRMPWQATFGQVEKGDHLLYEDSYGRLCIAQNQGDAARSLKVSEGTTVEITREGQPTDRGPGDRSGAQAAE